MKRQLHRRRCAPPSSKSIIPRTTMASLSFLICALAFFLQVNADHTLRQVHVITQLGASYPLNILHPDETELTASGEMQMHDLGVWLKHRYKGLLDTADPDLVHFESCASDRAVTSANALALGLFNSTIRDPHQENQLHNTPRPNVPVYTPHYNKMDDVTFRSYDTCNAYQTRLTGFFQGSAIKDLEEDSTVAPLLRKLSEDASLAVHKESGTGSISLQDIRSIVDIISVAKLECERERATRACHHLPNVHSLLTDDEWVSLQEYAYQIEVMKFSKEMAGTLLGGNILHRITNRMMSSYQDDHTAAHTYVYSAHDTTLWGVVAALQEYDWLEKTGNYGKLPPPASALILELYDRSHVQGENDFVVDLYFKPGNNDTATLFSTVCGNENMENCKLINLVQFADSGSVSGHWCNECGNDSAEICVREAHHQSAVKAPTATQPEVALECSNSNLSAVGGLFAGIVIGMVVSICGYLLCCRTKHIKSSDTAACNSTFQTETETGFT